MALMTFPVDEGMKACQGLSNGKGWILRADRYAFGKEPLVHLEPEKLTYETVQENIIFEGVINTQSEPSSNLSEYQGEVSSGIPNYPIDFKEIYLIVTDIEGYKRILSVSRLGLDDAPYHKEPRDILRLIYRVLLNNYQPEDEIEYSFEVISKDRFFAPELRSLLRAGSNCSIVSKNGKVKISNITEPPKFSATDKDFIASGIRPIWSGDDRLEDTDSEKSYFIRYHTL